MSNMKNLNLINNIIYLIPTTFLLVSNHGFKSKFLKLLAPVTFQLSASTHFIVPILFTIKSSYLFLNKFSNYILYSYNNKK